MKSQVTQVVVMNDILIIIRILVILEDLGIVQHIIILVFQEIRQKRFISYDKINIGQFFNKTKDSF